MLITGGGWLILDNFFQQKTALGLQKHPWQGFLISTHGVSSYLFSVLFGYILAEHVAIVWRRSRYRISGYTLIFSIGISILTGASFLFLPLGSFHSLVTWLHVGSAAVLFGAIVFHVIFKK